MFERAEFEQAETVSALSERAGRASGDRPGRWLWAGLAGTAVALALTLALAVGAPRAEAGQSGELAPGALVLGDATQPDIVVICDDRFDSKVKSCQLRSTASQSEGSAADVGGADAFNVIRRGDVFEGDVTVAATSSGDIRCAAQPGAEDAGFCDVCQTTFPPTQGSPLERSRGFNTCIRITHDGGSTPDDTVGPFTIANLDAGECSDLEAALTAPAGPFTDPRVGWTAGADIASAGQPGFVHIGLCPGRSWQLLASPIAASGVKVMEDVGIIITNTPGWACFDGWCGAF